MFSRSKAYSIKGGVWGGYVEGDWTSSLSITDPWSFFNCPPNGLTNWGLLLVWRDTLELDTAAHRQSAVKQTQSCPSREAFLSILCSLNSDEAAAAAAVSMLTPLAWAWGTLPSCVCLSLSGQLATVASCFCHSWKEFNGAAVHLMLGLPVTCLLRSPTPARRTGRRDLTTAAQSALAPVDFHWGGCNWGRSHDGEMAIKSAKPGLLELSFWTKPWCAVGFQPSHLHFVFSSSGKQVASVQLEATGAFSGWVPTHWGSKLRICRMKAVSHTAWEHGSYKSEVRTAAVSAAPTQPFANFTRWVQR